MIFRDLLFLQELHSEPHANHTWIASQMLPPVASIGSQMKTYMFEISFGSLL